MESSKSMIASAVIDDDDKYNKSSQKADLPSLRSKYDPNLVKVPTHILNYYITIFGFACWVLASFLVLVMLGIYDYGMTKTERFVMLQVEILGLVMLREKLKTLKSVSGASGMAFVMYAFTYLGRSCLVITPPWDKDFVLAEMDLDPILGFCSFLLVLDILKTIYMTHRDSYDAELDVLKAWHLIPACWAMALLIHASFDGWTWMFQYCWNAVLYMDVLALMPQVVMMARSGGKVNTPVANFVAATTFSRCGDVTHTFILIYKEWALFKSTSSDASIEILFQSINYSTWLVILVQLIHLVLVADFMYYYCKARAWTCRQSHEISVV